MTANNRDKTIFRLKHAMRRFAFIPLALFFFCILAACARNPGQMQAAPSQTPPEAALAAAQKQRLHGTLVLVHGIFKDGGNFPVMKRYFEKEGLQVLTPSLSPKNGAMGIAPLALQLRDYIEREVAPEDELYLVGYSMGGLVSRYYLQRLGGMKRVKRYVAISAPQHGSMWAWFLPSRGGRDMRPGSPLLDDLASDVEMLGQIPMLTLWTPLDLMIIPARSSLLPVGQTQKIWAPLHPLMLKNQRSLERIAAFLGAEEKRGE